MKIVTTIEAAAAYGTSPSSISRAAKKAGVGTRLSSGRLVGLSGAELRKLSRFLRYEPGNPNFSKPKQRRRPSSSLQRPPKRG